MRSQYHWPPKAGDRVYQLSRDDQGLWPHGEIIYVDRDWSDREAGKCIVKFFRHANVIAMRGYNLLCYDGETHWKIVGKTILYDGKEEVLDTRKFSYVYSGEEFEFGGCDDLRTYDFDAFSGNWSSSAGGNNRWEID